MNYTNILFDLDGTLTDPKEGITNSVAYALRSFGIETKDNDTLTPFIGPPLIHSFSSLYGFDEKKCLEAVEVYREYFSVHGKFENKLYDGIIPLLEYLRARGLRTFIATSKPQKFALEIARHFCFDTLLEAVRGIPMNGEDMSKAQVIDALVTEFGLDRRHTLMVGDRLYDVEGAHENDIDCLGVTYGYGSRDELSSAGADYTVDSVKQLRDFFEEMK